MKSILKLLRRFFGILCLSIILGLALNIILFVWMTQKYVFQNSGNGRPWKTAEAVSEELYETEDGYEISEKGETLLKDSGAWGILLENGSGNVIWESENLPPEIPLSYSLSEVAWSVRGYIEDYPTVSAGKDGNLVILGFPKKSYWKHLWSTYDYDLIAHTPEMILVFLIGNLIFLLVVYLIATTGVLRSVKPIIEGIRLLPEDRNVYLKEKGLFSQLAESINRAAEKLRSQDFALRRKETARANWIAGVSHDIRTPLSMVMGYASQLETDEHLPAEQRKKAEIIRLQSMRMKNLIADLNLASKLDYNVQPVHTEKINIVSFMRQVVVDFMNLDGESKYPIEWRTEENLPPCIVEGDKELLKRAVSNLIFNSQIHNPNGCTIFAEVKRSAQEVLISIEDNGTGVSDEKLEAIKKAPHYMVCDSSVREQSHGLGLLIVKQICHAHHGKVEISHSQEGGFSVKLLLPLKEI